MISENAKKDKILKELRTLSKNAKSGPWYAQGPSKKSGYATYRLKEAEEKLIVAMRNNIDMLLDMVDTK
jgi:hypothetical protein